MTDRDRILHWIDTGENEFKTNYVRQRAVGSTSIGLEGDQDPVAASSSESSAHHQDSELALLESSESEDCSGNSQDELLIGCEADPLIPTAEEINKTYRRGQNLWRTLVDNASSFPPGCVPTPSLDPSIMMQNVPPLPQNLQGEQSIIGQSMWYIPSPELSYQGQIDLVQDSGISDEIWAPAPILTDEEWDPELVCGVRKHFNLWVPKPTKFSISSRDDVFRYCTTSVQPLDDAPNGLAVFTICWSYILSARLLEMQGKSRNYSSMTLVPVLAKDLNPQPKDIVINLSSASTELVRWLCALLAPDSRWLVQRLPPWAVTYEGDYRFVIATMTLYTWDVREKLPSSTEAAQLLIELGTLFDLESQVTGGFLSALMLPVHNVMNLKPQLPLPRLIRPSSAQATKSGPIRNCVLNYLSNLPCYMTLSVDPISLSSAIWSIFWEPGINCNLVSAWLGSIYHTIDPILKAGDLEMLAKVFALYRPRLAPIWLGIALLGCPEFPRMIESYLTTLEEQPLFCRISRPDPDVAAWTGSPQSFLDEEGSGCYIKDGEVLLSRGDLVRLRFNYRYLSDTSETPAFGWQPLGSVKKEDVEPELQERLEEWRPRKLLRWIWYTKKGKIEHIFRDKHQDARKASSVLCSPHSLRDKHQDARNISSILSILENSGAKISGGHCAVKLCPSREATWRIMAWGLKMASGDVEFMEEVTEHKWLEGLR
jgi:hypothetical protein